MVNQHVSPPFGFYQHVSPPIGFYQHVSPPFRKICCFKFFPGIVASRKSKMFGLGTMDGLYFWVVP